MTELIAALGPIHSVLAFLADILFDPPGKSHQLPVDRYHFGPVDHMVFLSRMVCCCCACSNVSSDGEYARNKLRECSGLVDSVIAVVRASLSTVEMDSKAVENCVCVMRNLSYACQEVADPDYLSRRDAKSAAHTGNCSPLITFS